MFERETRREKILEARNKEIRLKEKTKVTGSFLKYVFNVAGYFGSWWIRWRRRRRDCKEIRRQSLSIYS